MDDKPVNREADWKRDDWEREGMDRDNHLTMFLEALSAWETARHGALAYVKAEFEQFAVPSRHRTIWEETYPGGFPFCAGIELTAAVSSAMLSGCTTAFYSGRFWQRALLPQ